MGKVTFVVDFEDGKEPPVNSGMSIFGGSLTDVAWRDALQDNVKLTSESLPSPNQMALLFDANGEGWLIGWRSMWMAMGQRETGEWQWTFQVGDIDDANITHWVEMPEAPEAL